MVERVKSAKKEARIAVVGKYFKTGDFVLSDVYISVLEALKHAAYSLKRKPVLEWLDSEEYENNPEALKELRNYDGVLIPGGFGSRGIEGKIQAIRFCRENKIPYFGICYGMQLAVIEYARHVLGLADAHTAEVNPDSPDLVIDIMPEQKANVKGKKYGGTMRLGSYPAFLKKGTVAHKAYRQNIVSERHRHRYEVNPEYVSRIEEAGLIFSGTSPDKRLMEIAELPASEHPFFLGAQFHPEFQSSPVNPHPLFVEFLKAAVRK
jgi:CTP synthase